MEEELHDGVNLYVGYEPPEDCLHLGRVLTNLAVYLDFALKSGVLSEGS